MNEPRNSSRTAGVTLIELLAAIGVTALLAAVSIAWVASARASARRTLSQSNLRQIALAHMSYETEHGRVPPLSNYDESGRSWAQRIAPHCGLKRDSFVPGVVPPGVFSIPGVQEVVLDEHFGTYSHYARNMVFTQTTTYVTKQARPEGAVDRLSDVATPSETMLVGEWKPVGHWSSAVANSMDEFPGFNGGRYAFAFVDGHVESYRAGRLPTQHDRYDPTFRAYFWDPRTEVLQR